MNVINRTWKKRYHDRQPYHAAIYLATSQLASQSGLDTAWRLERGKDCTSSFYYDTINDSGP